MINNMLKELMKPEDRCHDGIGSIHVYRAFDRKQLNEHVDHIDFVVVPPGATIGCHRHGDNTEWYVIMAGEGEMRFQGQQIRVAPWDVIVNQPYGEHALVNNSTQDIHLVVFQQSKRVNS
jgi:mannose-6-phosphate isomerase-like protein (cupin superfamily)